MKKIVCNIFFAFCVLATICTDASWANTACSGWTYYDYDSEACVTCENQGFTITTTSLATNTVFWFSMSPKGSFAVDWGDGNIDNINRTGTTLTDYPHTYTDGGVKTIKICGKATEYNPTGGDNVVTTITFYKTDSSNTSKWISSVSGSLGSVFPTIGGGTNSNQQPRFRETFKMASHLTEVPAGLFNGVSGSAASMFRSTFDRTGLIAIPEGLFANATGGAQDMFRSTFYLCTSLASLPAYLFAGITVAAKDEFRWTFYNASGLTGKYIPSTAFAGLVSEGAPSPAPDNMWYQTFDGSNLLKACPARTQQVSTGYEGSVAGTTWNGYVSCIPNNPCTGTQYWDSTNEACVSCPPGYTYDIKDTKESINECKIQCNTGTYLAAAGNASCTDAGVGYWATGGVFSYGQTSSRTQCPDNMPTLNNNTTASDVDQCVVYCRGTDYRNSNNSCVACPLGYNYDNTDGKTAITDCKIHCSGGTYLPTANASSCEDVGDGYWTVATTVAYGSTVSRNKCPVGQTTGVTNASSDSQCVAALCTGATYRDSLTGECVSCPVGYDAHTISGKTSINECQIHCYAGTYIANANDTVCTNVGDGFYAAASDINYGSNGLRSQCPSGQLTGTQTAASSSQCQTSCVGARYYNSTSGQCEDCPTGYTNNTTNGKNNINQCEAHCAAGTYLQIYTPVLYLQGDGNNQYIDTGYEITSTHVNGTLVVGTPTTLSGSNKDAGNFFGNIYGPGGFSANWKKGSFGLWLQNTKQSGKKAEYATAFNADVQYTVTYDVNVVNTTHNNETGADVGSGTARIQVDNNGPVTKDDSPMAINAKGNTFKLFTNGSAFTNNGAVDISRWGDKLFAGRIYSLQLYDNGVLVLDLIPVRREPDGALGMFNRVNNEFYVNSGSGNFVPGADNGATFGVCSPVGNGYYVGATQTGYGSTPIRYQCPNGLPTMVNGEIINNASSIYQCDGVEPCSGPMYPDPGTGVCVLCPGDYTYDTTNGKESINQCVTHCYAGTYVATAATEGTACVDVGNGYYAEEDTISWGDVGIRTRCPNGGVTNMTNAGSADACVPIGTCSGATYLNSGTCEPCPAGYVANTASGKTAATDCQLVCPEGSYMPTANATTCTDAGVGYWATGGVVNYGSTSSRNQCAAGLTTVGYGHGANEAADCGRKLHLGDFILYTKTTKPTMPAINVQIEHDTSTYYVGVSSSDHTLTPVHVTQGNTQYTAFDDSILHGERDLQTNTRIAQ